MTPLRYVLTSGSPRRRDLIRQVGIPARICPAVGKETSSKRDPRAYAADLARHKAQEIAQQEEKTPGDYCVIGADTIVVLDGAILGKPKDRADAKRMITALQGRSHEVITGVCLSYRRDGLSGQCAFSEVSSVRVVPMSEEEIDCTWLPARPMTRPGPTGFRAPLASTWPGSRATTTTSSACRSPGSIKR